MIEVGHYAVYTRTSSTSCFKFIRIIVDAGIYPLNHHLLFITPIFTLLHPHLEQYQMYGYMNMQTGT